MAETSRQDYRPSAAAAFAINDRYLLFLMLVLAGYALLGRGFAYVGYSPVFIGEITLVLGLIAFLWSSTAFAVLSKPLSLLVLAMFVWVMARTLPYIKEYGIEAFRDSMIVGYALYAFVIAGLLIERPERLHTLIGGYRRLAVVFALITPPLYVVSDFLYDALPLWPGSDAAILSLRGGDVAVHLCGIALFALLGFVRLPAISIISLFIGMVVVGSQNRGGTLAIILPILIAWVLVPKMRQLPRLAGLGGLTLLVCSVLGFSIALPWMVSERLISMDQLLTNIASIFGMANDPTLAATKLWRIEWWDKIIAYTLHGPYFWTGKGFGINLANADGFQVVDLANAPPLRSPHNSHLTMLARAGVPGLALWITVGCSWAGMMLWRFLQARSRGQDAWARLFVFVLCYWAAIVIDSSFDVALEGPMLGIWFWTLFGIGMAASMIYAAQQTRSGTTPRAF